ncbi:MAG: DUF3775 domain-containing protein [Pseudomonadota bacterium]
MLTISPQTVFYIIVKAREFDEKVEPNDPNPGSNPSDDMDVEILEDRPDDPTAEELRAAIDGLNEDEQLDLIALAWLGRGSFDSYKEARDEAGAKRREHTADYLMGMPLLGEYLEEGLTALGYDLEEYELDRL